MHLDLTLTHQEIDLQAIRGKNCVVIDTLRATSTIITALGHGCPEIIPVSSAAEALRLKKRKIYRNYILGGEIEGQNIAAFQCGNSPLEYCKGDLKGRGIILSTTNGTRIFKKLKEAENVIICALLNTKTVGEYLLRQKTDILLCCAGRRGNFSLEDFLTAGRLAAVMLEQEKRLSLSDLACTAAIFYSSLKQKQGGKTVLETLKNSENGKRLLAAGLEKDIEHCGQEDIFPLLPFYKNGSIKPF